MKFPTSVSSRKHDRFSNQSYPLLSLFFVQTTEDDLRQKPGFFNKRFNKVQPLAGDATQNAFNGHGRIVGGGDTNDMEDPEMQENARLQDVRILGFKIESMPYRQTICRSI